MSANERCRRGLDRLGEIQRSSSGNEKCCGGAQAKKRDAEETSRKEMFPCVVGSLGHNQEKMLAKKSREILLRRDAGKKMLLRKKIAKHVTPKVEESRVSKRYASKESV